MAENYDYQYIENNPGQIIYTTQPEIIQQNKYTTADNYIYEIPQTYQPSQTQNVYTVTHKPKKVQYQPVIEQQIYTIDKNKNQVQNYVYEYPVQNNKNNPQIYQYENHHQNKAKSNNINYNVQQNPVKTKYDDNVKYVYPQNYIDIQDTQKQKIEIKEHHHDYNQPQYYNQNQYQHHQQQIIYQDNNYTQNQNNKNIVQQYQNIPQHNQIKPKQYQNQPQQNQIKPKQNPPPQEYQIQPQQYQKQPQVYQNQPSQYHNQAKAYQNQQPQYQKQQKIQNNILYQHQQNNPQLNKIKELNPKTQTTPHIKNNQPNYYIQPQQVGNLQNQNQIYIQNNKNQILINPQINNQQKVNIYNQVQLQPKRENKNIQNNTHPELIREIQGHPVERKINQQNQILYQNNNKNAYPNQMINNNNIQYIQNPNEYYNNNDIAKRKIVQKPGAVNQIQNNNNINQNFVNNHPKVQNVQYVQNIQNVKNVQNINAQNVHAQNQIKVPNVINININDKTKENTINLKTNQVNKNPIQTQPQAQIENQNLVNKEKNEKNEKKELSSIQEEDSKIVQSGFVKKEDNFKIDFIEKEKENKLQNDLVEEEKEKEKEKENEKNVPKLDEPNNENEVNKPIEGKIPEKTFSKDIENVEIKLNNEPLQQSTGADMDDNLDHLPTINSIMKGNAEPLPPSKKKKY